MRSEDAVSSVVGTVLILAITVSAFGGIALVVMQEVEQQGTAPRIDLQVQSAQGQFIVSHRGGPSLPVADGMLYVYDGVERHELLLSAFPSLGPTWDIGETVIVTEAFSGVPVGVEVIVRTGGRSTLLAFGGDRTAASGGGGPVLPADLIVATVHAVPMVVGSPVRFSASLQNLGGAAPGSQTLFEVLDGPTVVWTAAASVPYIPAGGSRTVHSAFWPTSAGSFTVRATADSLGVVTESDEANNAWTSGTFTPAATAAGLGFVDVEGDGIFTPGSDQQIQAGALTAQQCSGYGCAGGDVGYIVTGPFPQALVMSASGTALTTGASIFFHAPGDVAVHVAIEGGGGITVRSTEGAVVLTGDATATGNQAGILLEAAGDLLVSGLVQTLGNQGVATLVAGGDITADGATMSSNDIIFTAPAAARIQQSGLSFTDRGGITAELATNTNNSCVAGTLTVGGWTQTPTVCS